MRNFKNASAVKHKNALEIAQNLNYYGKRLLSKKTGIAEQISEQLTLKNTAISSIVSWLDDNKPTKTTAKQAKQKEQGEPVFKGDQEQRDQALKVLDHGRYIITSAQNNTAPHPTFYALKKLADKCDATLLVMPINYLTTLEKEERENVAFNIDIVPFLVPENCFIGDRSLIRLCCSANVLPTAKQPINTAKLLNQGENLTVIASPKQQTMTLPRAKGQPHRWLYTSRSATLRHYTESRAGDEAENLHTFGGLFLDVRKDGTITHQELQAGEDGSVFFPLIQEVNEKPPKIKGLVLGDLHCEKMCGHSLQKAVDQISYLQPDQVILHDSLDFMSRNHHNKNSGRFLYQMGSRSVIQDLKDTVRIINYIAGHLPKNSKVFIVFSNHDDALSQWLDCSHYRPDHDPINAKTYHFLKYCVYDFLDKDDHEFLNCFSLACAELADQVGELSQKVIFGELDQSNLVGSFETGHHGHHGSGGSRGSARTFKGYSVPIITGHTHSPQRDNNQITVGVTGSLDMGYNKGGSSWDRSNAVIYDDKAVLIQPFRINEPQK